MTYRIARISLVAILIVVLVVPPPPASACGPDFTGPNLFATTGPEFPYANYARGKLELLQHSYWHEPLYVAYRNLSGKPFTPAELKIFTEPSAEENAAAGENWVETWNDTRAKVVGKAAGNSRLYDSGHGITRQVDLTGMYLEYYNCLDNAFEFAVRTLTKRVEQFGAQSAVVEDWIVAQDMVFTNCSGSGGLPPKSSPATMPATASVSDSELVHADRAYQVAAAHFYAGQYAMAQQDFEAIAKDSASPYHHLASYLVARVLIRKGTLEAGEEDYNSGALAQAETKLRAIIADKNLTEMHDPAEHLLGFVRIRLHRQERFQELETLLSNGGSAKTFRQDLTDYLWLLDHSVLTKSVTLPPESAGQPPRKGVTVDETTRLQGADMTDWILTFQQTGDSAFEHSLERWQPTKSLPWLVAAIAKVGANNKAAADLSAAAAKIPSDSPAYLTLTFHRLRLLEQSGNRDTARQQLDQLFAQRGPTLSRSARNQFVALRMKLATSLPDFLQFAPRTSNDAEAYPNPPSGTPAPRTSDSASHFDADSSVVLTEKLPLRMLVQAAKSTALPKPLRRELVIAAWTRAILLEQDATARELVPTAQELVPEAEAEFAEYSRTADVESLRFAAVLAMLRNPGFRPFVTAGYPRGNLYTVEEPGFNKLDNLHDNWWCASTPTPENQSYGRDYFRMFITLSSPLRDVYPEDKFPSPFFLTADDRTTAAKEHTELEAQSAAPNWLGKRALDWASAHPDDPRVPEALHLVVRAWRYGCTESSGTNYSKAAYDLLHKRYPASEWTKKTPFWFN
jgi:tetratricopeptide (TPR) repeat protein